MNGKDQSNKASDKANGTAADPVSGASGTRPAADTGKSNTGGTGKGGTGQAGHGQPEAHRAERRDGGDTAKPPAANTGEAARVRIGGDITGQKSPLPATLLKSELEVVYDRVRTLWAGEVFYPEASRDAALGRVQQLIEVAQDGRCTTLGQLIKNHREVLTEAHKVVLDRRSLTGFLPGAVADPLHRDRNLLLAVAMTAAVNRGADPSPQLRRWVKLQRRTGQDGRPAFDDEIVLFRLYRYAGAGSGDERRIQGALAYTLNEAGARPYEAVQAEPTKFDQPLTPSWFDAPGVHTGAARADQRRLHLDEYGRAVAAKTLGRLHELKPTRTRLVYDGTNIGASAAVGQNRACGQMIDALGLGAGKFRDLTASSIWKWKAAAALDSAGIAAAMNITGMDEKRTYEALRRHIPLPEQRPDSPDDLTF